MVRVIDKEDSLYETDLRIVVIRLCKKGILCAIENGAQKIFKHSDIDVYPD